MMNLKELGLAAPLSALLGMGLLFAACTDKQRPAESVPPTDTSTPTETPAPSGSVGSGEQAVECKTDADCVPASCCHATACIPAAQKPSCETMVCTLECRPGTLDCGGGCLCSEGKCAITLRKD